VAEQHFPIPCRTVSRWASPVLSWCDVDASHRRACWRHLDKQALTLASQAQQVSSGGAGNVAFAHQHVATLPQSLMPSRNSVRLGCWAPSHGLQLGPSFTASTVQALERRKKPLAQVACNSGAGLLASRYFLIFSPPPGKAPTEERCSYRSCLAPI
jgi:hypothetical protein